MRIILNQKIKKTKKNVPKTQVIRAHNDRARSVEYQYHHHCKNLPSNYGIIAIAE